MFWHQVCRFLHLPLLDIWSLVPTGKERKSLLHDRGFNFLQINQWGGIIWLETRTGLVMSIIKLVPETTLSLFFDLAHRPEHSVKDRNTSIACLDASLDGETFPVWVTDSLTIVLGTLHFHSTNVKPGQSFYFAPYLSHSIMTNSMLMCNFRAWLSQAMHWKLK